MASSLETPRGEIVRRAWGVYRNHAVKVYGKLSLSMCSINDSSFLVMPGGTLVLDKCHLSRFDVVVSPKATVVVRYCTGFSVQVEDKEGHAISAGSSGFALVCSDLVHGGAIQPVEEDLMEVVKSAKKAKSRRPAKTMKSQLQALAEIPKKKAHGNEVVFSNKEVDVVRKVLPGVLKDDAARKDLAAMVQTGVDGEVNQAEFLAAVAEYTNAKGFGVEHE